jgi:hypothetical protein
MDSTTREAGGKMLHERMSQCAIRRMMHVSMPWLLWFCSTWYSNVPAHLGCRGHENLKKE